MNTMNRNSKISNHAHRQFNGQRYEIRHSFGTALSKVHTLLFNFILLDFIVYKQISYKTSNRLRVTAQFNISNNNVLVSILYDQKPSLFLFFII